MSDWLLSKYIGYISPRLERFKRKSPTLYNFRCPICNDSQDNKSKARGYIYEKQGNMMFHCHNCGVTMSVPNFIKHIDKNLYDEYIVEKLRDEKSPQQIELESFVEKMKPPVFLKAGPLKGLKKVSQLSPNDPIKTFVANRKIPNPYHAKLFAVSNFMQYVNELVPNKFSKEALQKDEKRLLIPFFDKNKNMFAFQGRSINKSKLKYITIVLDESKPKLYGLDTSNFDQKVYVMEGPIDSMFIPNSIATAGGDLVSALGPLSSSKTSMVVVYDNEPRSRETIKKLDKAINSGYNVVIWPDNFEQKDVNEMVLAGLSPEFIKHIMDTNTYRDLAAKLALTKWSKI